MLGLYKLFLALNDIPIVKFITSLTLFDEFFNNHAMRCSDNYFRYTVNVGSLLSENSQIKSSSVVHDRINLDISNSLHLTNCMSFALTYNINNKKITEWYKLIYIMIYDKIDLLSTKIYIRNG